VRDRRAKGRASLRLSPFALLNTSIREISAVPQRRGVAIAHRVRSYDGGGRARKLGVAWCPP
jgi:hypothetical protein